MTGRRPRKATAQKSPKRATPAADALVVVTLPGADSSRALARTMLNPSVTSALTLQKMMQAAAPTVTTMALIDELSEQCAQVSQGNLSRPEAMLTAQAHTLDVLFGDLTRLAHANIRDHFEAAERIFRLAFRAQGQSRATLETLGALKNPPAVFARQANIANGPQQVNNGVARPHEIEAARNKLLEQTDGKRLDAGTTSGTSRGDTEMETVGALNGTAKR